MKPCYQKLYILSLEPCLSISQPQFVSYLSPHSLNLLFYYSTNHYDKERSHFYNQEGKLESPESLLEIPGSLNRCKMAEAPGRREKGAMERVMMESGTNGQIDCSLLKENDETGIF